MIAFATVLIIGLSAFFVAVEFSLISAKRHRLQDAAAHSRGARAALRSSSELTLLLAGSQLGITVCTLALGAVTKPALHDTLLPVFVALGLPEATADVVAFVLALVVATFLHLVIGEMMPKSWAIAHPERSAILLALPMRAFMRPTRPLLRLLNDAANALVRRLGIDPVDEVAAGQDPEALRELVAHSANVGALEATYRTQIEGALDLRTLTLGGLLEHAAGGRPRDLTTLPATASVAHLQEASRRTGHLRVLLAEAGAGRPAWVVHVRDTIAEPDPHTPVRRFARPVFELPPETPVHDALAAMRATRNHLALVTGAGGSSGAPLGVVTLSDILRRILPTAEPSA